MANTLGSLVVRLGLDASDFTGGLNKSEAQARRFAQSVEGNIAKAIVKAELALDALAGAARTAVQVFQSLTTGAASFQDLAEETGAAAADLASLAVSAAVAGVEMTSVAAATGKLTKNLVGVDDESKAAGAALKALNINVADFKKLDPVAQYEAIGKALGNYADGAGKVAVAQALFGKSGAEQLKVFKALEEAGGRQVILTTEQIAAADAYADRQAKSAATLRLYAQAAATQALPALTALSDASVDVAKALLGVDKASGELRTSNAVRDFAFDAAKAVAVLAESLVGLVKLARSVGGSFQAVAADVALPFQVTAAAVDPKGGSAAERLIAVKRVLDERNKIVAESNQRYIDLWNYDGTAMSKAIDRARYATQRGLTGARADAFTDPRSTLFGTQPKPQLKFNGVDTEGAARLKKELDGRLKAIREAFEQEKDLYDFASRYVKGTYDDGLTTLRQYYESERQIRAAGLAAQLAALDEEASALRDARAKASGPDRVDIDNRIRENAAKRSQVVQKASTDGILAAQDEGRAVKALKDRYDELQASILALGGDTAGASRIRIGKQVEEARKLIAQQGGDPAQADRYATLLTNTEALNKAQRDYSTLVESARLQEEELLLIATERGSTELETMQAIKAVRSQTLDQMAEMVRKARELADALGTPEARLFADQLAVGFRRAAAEADPLLTKLRDVGREAGSSIASAFEDAIVSGRGLSDTLKSIEKDLFRIAYRQLVTKPFENWLGGLIGGNGSSSGGGGWLGAALGWLTGRSGTSAGGGGNIGFAPGGGAMAMGGPTRPFTVYKVGEQRPEVFDDGSNQYLLTGARRGRVHPNPQFGGGGRTINAPMTINVPGNTDGRTATQIGAEVSRKLAIANARRN